MRYHRQIVAYHGCLVDRFEAALLRGVHPPFSDEVHDWLGRGIYFWEHGPYRAMDWAKRKARRSGRPESDARVLGAVINLGRSLDLMDIQATRELAEAHARLQHVVESAPGMKMPSNDPGKPGDVDRIKRHLDCAVINTAAEIAGESGTPIQTVRSAFWEGGPAYDGAAIQRESHIQVAVRDTDVILHYFNGMEDATR